MSQIYIRGKTYSHERYNACMWRNCVHEQNATFAFMHTVSVETSDIASAVTIVRANIVYCLSNVASFF